MDGFSFKDRILRLTWRFRQMGKVNYLSSFSSPNVFWIETGTYLGNTTKRLAQNSMFVFSLEPMERFFLKSGNRLRRCMNVTVLNLTSEQGILFCLLEIEQMAIKKKNSIRFKLNLFLDGHYSGPGTFRSDNSTPILLELSAIRDFFAVARAVELGFVFIDDARLFFDDQPGYPRFQDLKNEYTAFEFEHIREHDLIQVRSL